MNVKRISRTVARGVAIIGGRICILGARETYLRRRQRPSPWSLFVTDWGIGRGDRAEIRAQAERPREEASISLSRGGRD